MLNKSDRDIMKMFNRVLDDYGFECVNISLGQNGIQRIYNDYTCFENMRLQIVTNNKGAYVTLYNFEELLFEDILGIDIIRLYYKDGVSVEFLVEVIVSTIDDYLEGDLDE